VRALREHEAINSVAAPLISTLIRGAQILVIGRSTKTGNRAFSNPQRPLLNTGPVVIKMLMT